MRHLLAFLLILGVGGISTAVAQIPYKTVVITNDTKTTLYPILQTGKRPLDNWLIAQFQITDSAKTYPSTYNYFTFINEDQGLKPTESVTVRVPFYSQLVNNPTGTQNNEYIDWWNGGRILLYDQPAQLGALYAADEKFTDGNLKNPVVPLPSTPGPCVVIGNNCTPAKIFRNSVLPQPSDRSQLLEFTFGDAITAGGTLPYPMKLTTVGYNISSVDQVYLPVAMEAFLGTTDAPLGYPYIGTILPVGDTRTPGTFRYLLNQWLIANPGWPIYTPTDTGLPVRIPGAFPVFSDAFTGSTAFTPPGRSAQALVTLYDNCTMGGTDAICTPYNQVMALINANYAQYLACGGTVPRDVRLEKLKRLYGWVPFEWPSCPSNNLVNALGPVAFTIVQQTYISQLQNMSPFAFNPYVSLIHGGPYLKMAAYAFSVDDDISYQHFTGDGIYIDVGGSNGLPNKTLLDKKNRVVVNLAISNTGVPQWKATGACTTTADVQVDPLFPSREFYPPAYPCMFTAQDLKGEIYQLVVNSPPPLVLDLTKMCPISGPNKVTNLKWCNAIQVPNDNTISTIIPDPDPLFSTHDFDGNGKSDLLWRDSSGNLAAWLMNGAQIAQVGSLGSFATFGVPGIRDFNADGKADLLLRDANGNTFVILMDGTRIIPASINPNSMVNLGNVPPIWKVVGTTYFDSGFPGLGSILWQDNSGNVAAWTLDVRRAPKDGYVIEAVSWGQVDPALWSVVGISDFDGDGRPDILWRDTSGNLAIWFVGPALTIAKASGVGAIPATWSVVGTGDFDGDGKGDILWQDKSGNTVIWLMSGATVKSTVSLGVIPAVWSVATTGDFDFNGTSDILWTDSSGNIALWLTTPVTVTPVQALSVSQIPTTWAVQPVQFTGAE